MVRELKRRGVRFAVSSGRQYYNLLKLFEPVRDEVTFICENGAIVFENHRNVYCSEIGFDRLVEPLRAIRAIRGAEPVFCGLKSAYAKSRDPFFLENACRYYERLEIVPDILEAAKQDKICKVAVFDAVDAESNCYVRLERFRDGFMVILSGSRWVDLMNPGVDKGDRGIAAAVRDRSGRVHGVRRLPERLRHDARMRLQLCDGERPSRTESGLPFRGEIQRRKRRAGKNPGVFPGALILCGDLTFPQFLL